MMLADGIPTWQSTVAVLAFFGTGIIGGLTLYFMWRQTNAFDKQTKLLQQQATKPTTISPQPLTVEVVKALHEQFADREEFKNLVKHTTERHSQIFSRIDRVERDTRIEMERRLTELNNERRQTLERLNNEFVFIRENIAGINRELQIRNES